MELDFLLVTIIIASLVVGYMAYDYFFKGKTGGKRVRILLFEHVGNDKVFKGERIGIETDDDKLGIYFLIKKEKQAISDVRNDDLFYDPKYGKCLLVCKYAADDYRVMSRLRDSDWAKFVPKLDKKGEPILDKEGEPEQDLKMYEEPLGVTQEDREVARFNLDYKARMAEFRKEKQGFWEKYAPYISVAFVAVMLMMSFTYMSRQNSKTQMHIADTFVEGAGEYQKAATSPSFAEGLLKQWEQRELEEEAPPR